MHQMLAESDVICHPHIFPKRRIDVALMSDPKDVAEIAIRILFYSMKSGVFVSTLQPEGPFDVVLTDVPYAAEAHLRHERHTSLHSVECDRANLPVFFQKVSEKLDAAFGLPVQKILQRILDARMPEILLHEFSTALRTFPERPALR